MDTDKPTVNEKPSEGQTAPSEFKVQKNMIVPIPKDNTGLEIIAPEYNCYGIVDSVDNQGNAMVTGAGTCQEFNARTLKKLATKFPKGEPLWGSSPIAWTICNPSDLIVSEPEGICWSGWANYIDKISISIDPAVYHKGVHVKYLGISYEDHYLVLIENRLGWADQRHFTQPQTTNELSPLETMFKIKKPEKFTPGCVGSIVGIKEGTHRYLEDDDGSLRNAVQPARCCYGIVVDTTSRPSRTKVIMAHSNTTWLNSDDLVLPDTLNSEECKQQFSSIFKEMSSKPCIDRICKFSEIHSGDCSDHPWYTSLGDNVSTKYSDINIKPDDNVILLQTVNNTKVFLWNNFVLCY